MGSFKPGEILVVAVSLPCEHTLSGGRDPSGDAIASCGSKDGLPDPKWSQVVAHKEFELIGLRVQETHFPTVPLEQVIDGATNSPVKNLESASDGVALMTGFVKFKNARRVFMNLTKSRQGNPFWPQIPLGERG